MKKFFIGFSFLIIGYALHAESEDRIRTIRNQKTRFVEFTFTDMLGNNKSIIRPIQFLETDLKRGIFCDGSSIVGCKHITESDMLLMPDLDSVRFLPWTNNETKMASIICNMHVNCEEPCEIDPRYVLRKTIEKASTLGYSFLVGPELEFYVFNNQNDTKGNLVPCDSIGYIDSPQSCNAPNIQAQVLNCLYALDIDPQKIHHEVAPGQYEIVLYHDTALKIADKLAVAKHSLKMLGALYNLKISFMPKPLFGQNGSGMHMHFSLVDKQTNQNLFYQADNEIYLSPIARSFIAGILAHTREMALIFNPSVNSYKRLVAGFEAPIYVCCGTKNRSALIRIPQINPDEANAARAEIRCPDPLCNPYLTIAALLQAGLDGIEKKLSLDITAENLYQLDSATLLEKNIATLPGSLREAINCFQSSEFMKELLGEQLFYRYLNEKKKELREFEIAVTDWELERYA
jgi:glutamine synthetase